MANPGQIDMTLAADGLELEKLGGLHIANVLGPWRIIVHAAGLVHGKGLAWVIGSRVVQHDCADPCRPCGRLYYRCTCVP